MNTHNKIIKAIARKERIVHLLSKAVTMGTVDRTLIHVWAQELKYLDLMA